VNINTSKIVKRGAGGDPFREFFGDDFTQRFFGPQHGSERQTSLGSGFVIDKDGYILTNRHVVDGADKIQVTFPNGKKYDAKLVGEDRRTDVALIKIEPRESLTVIHLGDSDQIDVGEWVMAIGNPFGLGGNSVTVGVVSYKGRPLDLSTHGTPIEMIQTDAAINPGNSGGPLLDTQGHAVGINTLIITQGASQSSGVGFAVPINAAKEVIPQLRATGKVVRGWLGVQVQALDEDMSKSLKMADTNGALVSDVTSGSPAEKAGLKAGDVVVRFGGQPIATSSDLSRRVAEQKPGETTRLDILREGSPRTLTATLGTFPEGATENGALAASKGAMGMQVESLTPDLASTLGIPSESRGVVVDEVSPGSAAEAAGLQHGDVIVNVGDRAVVDTDSFQAEIGKARSEGLVRLRVRRANRYLFLVVHFE